MDNGNVDFYGENLKRIGLKHLEVFQNSYDLVLTSSDKRWHFRCHKLILSACSAWVQNFFNSQKQYGYQIPLPFFLPLPYNHMEIRVVLDFIYYGTLSGLDQVCISQLFCLFNYKIFISVQLFAISANRKRTSSLWNGTNDCRKVQVFSSRY